MTADEYQKAVLRTRPTEMPTCDMSLPWVIKAMCALGIAGEAGEVADLLKKHLFHGHPLDKEKLRKELGDVAWYLCAIASEHDIPFSEVLEENIEKLKRRYPEGFSEKASQERPKE